MSSFAEDVEKFLELAKRKDGSLLEEKKKRREKASLTDTAARETTRKKEEEVKEEEEEERTVEGTREHAFQKRRVRGSGSELHEKFAG